MSARAGCVFTVYLIRGPTGKRYVGITSKSVRARWGEHCRETRHNRWKSALHDAMRLHGVDAFSVEVVTTCVSWETACQLEIEAIKSFGTFNPNGYNITLGGEGRLGVKHCDEFKRMISRIHTGKVVSEETRARLSAAHSSMTDEQKRARAVKMAAANARRTDAERVRISEAIAASKRGKKRPPEVIAKMTAARWGKQRGEIP